MDSRYFEVLKEQIEAELVRGDFIEAFHLVSEVKRRIRHDARKIIRETAKKGSDLIMESYGIEKSKRDLVFCLGVEREKIGRRAYTDLEKYAQSCPFNLEVYDLADISFVNQEERVAV